MSFEWIFDFFFESFAQQFPIMDDFIMIGGLGLGFGLKDLAGVGERGERMR